MPFIDVVHTDKFGYAYEEFDSAEWTRFPNLREVSELELVTLRNLSGSNTKLSEETLQNLLKTIHDRPEVDAEEHAQ